MIHTDDFPTPFAWQGKTLKQEHILRYLDRKNPIGRVMQVHYPNDDSVVAVDVYGFSHTFVGWEDGRVTEV